MVSFSPLRFWGHLYQEVEVAQQKFDVLVPFGFGVIYILITVSTLLEKSFSPLRFWGHLYHQVKLIWMY